MNTESLSSKIYTAKNIQLLKRMIAVNLQKAMLPDKVLMSSNLPSLEKIIVSLLNGIDTNILRTHSIDKILFHMNENIIKTYIREAIQKSHPKQDRSQMRPTSTRQMKPLKAVPTAKSNNIENQFKQNSSMTYNKQQIKNNCCLC